MKVLVTGGAGYIGSHIVHDLINREYIVYVIDSLDNGDLVNLPDSKNLFFIKGKIQDLSVLESVLKEGISVCFHFAAWKASGESMENPGKYAENNLSGSLILLDQLIRHGCNNFIFSSTAAVYGEPKYLPIDETHPLNPENYYGFTKLSIEENLKWFCKIKDLNYAALRYFNAAGYDINGRVKGLEKKPNNLLPVIMETCIGIRKELLVFGNNYDTPDGTCIRDYIHVNDLASAHLLAMDYLLRNKKSITVNLGSEKGFSVKNMIDVAEKIVGKKIPYKIVERRVGDVPMLYASSKLAKTLFQWEPKYSNPENLIESMWKVYKNSFTK